MRKPPLHISRSRIIELIGMQSLRILAVLILGIFVYVAFFLKTNLVDTVYSPQAIPESEITARQQRVNAKLFEQELNEFQKKTNTSGDDLSTIRNPFTSL